MKKAIFTSLFVVLVVFLFEYMFKDDNLKLYIQIPFLVIGILTIYKIMK